MLAGARKNTDQRGFSLLEMIAVLVLVGLLAVVAGVGLTAVTKGYLMARESTGMAQKAQLALSRLSNEFLVCYNCIGEDESIDLPITYDSTEGDNRVINLDGGYVTINGAPLVDRVSEFSLKYDEKGMVVIELTLEHQQAGEGLPFSTRVLPRNSYQ